MRRMFSLMEEAAGDTTGAGSGRDFTAEASKMGWVPEDKWHGKTAWIDAETFVKRGEEVLPIVQADNRKLREQVASLSAQNAQIAQETAEFKTYLEGARAKDKANYEAQLTELQQIRKDAVTSGDGEAFAAADDRIDKLKAAAATGTTPPAQQQAPMHPDWAPWLAENQWYSQDQDLMMEANSLVAITAKKTGLTGRALFEAIKAKVAKLNPDKFDEVVERGGGPEERTEPTAPPRKGGAKAQTYENLPLDAKKACDNFIAKGWISGKNADGKEMTLAEKRASYCKDYQWD